jgi:hypothetical protein
MTEKMQKDQGAFLSDGLSCGANLVVIASPADEDLTIPRRQGAP